MARTSKTNFVAANFFLHWTVSKSRGTTDLLPVDWFRSEGTRPDCTHDILASDGKLYPARCLVRVKGRTAILDYASKHKKYNEDHEIYAGQTKIGFSDPARLVPSRVWWRDDTSGARYKTDVATIHYGESDLEAIEGTAKLRQHLQRERSPRLRAEKITETLANNSKLSCEACGFSFADKYGDLGATYCEVHHRNPVASGVRRVRTKDLAVLCSNCHRMIHLVFPLVSVEDFAEKYIRP